MPGRSVPIDNRYAGMWSSGATSPQSPETIRTDSAARARPVGVKLVEAGRGVEDSGVDLLGRRGRGGAQAGVPRDLVGEARPHPEDAQRIRQGADLRERVEHLLAQRRQTRGGQGLKVELGAAGARRRLALGGRQEHEHA